MKIKLINKTLLFMFALALLFGAGCSNGSGSGGTDKEGANIGNTIDVNSPDDGGNANNTDNSSSPVACTVYASQLETLTPADLAKDEFGDTYTIQLLGYWTAGQLEQLGDNLEMLSKRFVTLDMTQIEGRTSIGKWSFDGCVSLAGIMTGESMTSIGSGAFYGCSSLESVKIDSETSVGSWAFSVCTALKSVILGNGVTNIDNAAFSGCSSLESVAIGTNVMSINGNAFEGCTGYTLTLGAVDLVGKDYSYNSFSSNNSNLASLFVGCKVLIIKDGVTSIGKNAFNMEQYYSDSFYSKSNAVLESVTIPNSVESIGSSAFKYCYLLSSVTMGNSVTNIGSSAFYDCSSLESIKIPASVKNIKSAAFAGCTSLRNISFAGTTKQWDAINKEEGWSYDVPATKVICSNGNVLL